MQLIHNWEELNNISPSKYHYLDINLKYGCGNIREIKTNKSVYYLNTHTFYGEGIIKHVSDKLQLYGFDVNILGWDFIEVRSFKELEEINPSTTHYIEVEVDSEDSNYNSYWISPFDKSDEFKDYYLSTHAFYGGETTKEYNKILRKCGIRATLIGDEK